MPGQINRTPDGVMGFLGIKNFGRMPEDLANFLQGTWDLQQWYLNTNVTYAATIAGAVALGSLITFTAPQNQIWYVTNFSVSHVANAASSNRLTAARFGQVLTQVVGMGPSSIVTGGASASGITFGIYEPFILGAGESLGVTVSELTGTGTLNTSIRYRPMDV